MSLQPIGASALPSNATGQSASVAPSSSFAPSSLTTGSVADSKPATPAQKPTDQQVQHAVSDLQQAVAQHTEGLEFSHDKASGRDIVKVVDTATNKVIRQFPSEEALNLAHSIGNPMSGLLINQKA